MTPALKLAGLGAVLVAGAAYWLRPGSPERESVKTVSAATVVIDRAAEADDQGPAGGLDDPRRTAVHPTSTPAGAPDGAAPQAPSTSALSSASLQVSVTWSDGTVAAGLQVRTIDVGRNSYDPLEARTDAGGECTVDGLRAGTVWVSVERMKFPAKTQVAAGDENELAIQLERGWDVEGTVVDANGDAVEGAVVWLGEIWGNPESSYAVTTSAADGSFLVRSCPNLCSLWARTADHAPTLVRIVEETRTQPEGTSVSITLALGGASASVSGEVRDPDGNPVEGALVLVDGQDMLHGSWQTLPGGHVICVSRSGPTSVRTDASGGFSVDGVLPGTVPLGVLAPGFAAWRGSVSVAAGASGQTTITLAGGFRLSGTVRDAAGNPVAGRVMLWAPRLSTQLSPTVMTGPDGTFEIDGISPGEIHVTVDASGGEASTTLTGAAGDELTWEAYLGPEPEGEEGAWVESEPWE